jgi:hypothetical protein
VSLRKKLISLICVEIRNPHVVMARDGQSRAC